MKVVIAGHVDHGKSTLIGRLLYDSGSLPTSRLSEMQVMAEEYKKKFEFAYFMDAFADEVKQERTIDTTEVFFKGRYLHTLIDVPGHLEFIEAMLTGASHAEAAIVVVDVTRGVEEQTRRHLNLIQLLGIKNIIVAINKMDLQGHNLDCDDIQLELKDFVCLPISAREGTNVYSGDNPLIAYIDALEEQKEEKVLPYRYLVQGNYQNWILGSKVCGEDPIVMQFQPSGIVSPVVFYEDGNILLEKGLPPRGDVGGVYDKPLRVEGNIWTKVFILTGVIKVGDEFGIRCGTAKVPCKIESVYRRISSEIGKDINGKVLHKHDLGEILIHTSPLVVETFEDLPELGRFTLSKKDKDVAIGVINSYE